MQLRKTDTERSNGKTGKAKKELYNSRINSNSEKQLGTFRPIALHIFLLVEHPVLFAVPLIHRLLEPERRRLLCAALFYLLASNALLVFQAMLLRFSTVCTTSQNTKLNTQLDEAG